MTAARKSRSAPSLTPATVKNTHTTGTDAYGECACGEPLPARTGRGGPRRHCLSCRPRRAYAPRPQPHPSRSAECAGGCSKRLHVSHSSRPSPKCQACRSQGRERPCPVCELLFKAVRRPDGEWTRTCSRSCAGRLRGQANRTPEVLATRRASRRARDQRRRDRLAAATVEVVDPRSVFERDDWTCYLCRRPVDPSLSGRHRLGATLDHIVPLVAGGEHSYANVRTAHQRCNSAKGARVAGVVA